MSHSLIGSCREGSPDGTLAVSGPHRIGDEMAHKERPPDKVETERLGDAVPMAEKERPEDVIHTEHIERGKRDGDEG